METLQIVTITTFAFFCLGKVGLSNWPIPMCQVQPLMISSVQYYFLLHKRLTGKLNFYRLTPVSKPVNKRLVMLRLLLLGQETHKTHNTSKAPKTSCTPSTYNST